MPKHQEQATSNQRRRRMKDEYSSAEILRLWAKRSKQIKDRESVPLFGSVFFRPVTMDAVHPSLQRTFDEVRVPYSDQVALVTNYGLRNYKDLKAKRRCLETKSLLGVSPTYQRILAAIPDFVESEGLSSQPDPLYQFSGASFNLHFIEKSQGPRWAAANCYERLPSWLHTEDGLRRLLKLPPDEVSKLIDMVVDNVKDKYLCPELIKKEKCEHFLKMWTAAILFNFDGQAPPDKTSFLVDGPTQGGKSGWKAIAAGISKELKLPAIIVTHQVKESMELYSKLEKFDVMSPVGDLSNRIASVSQPRGGPRWGRRKDEINNSLSKGGTLVAAYTACQLRKVIDQLKSLREEEQVDGINRGFVLILDEADVMYRTENRDQKVEQAFAELMAMGPYLTIMLTATPVPLYLLLDGFQSLSIGTSPDYMGLDSMEPFKDPEGTAQFLNQGELKHSQGIDFEGSHIPYTNDKTMMLYEDASGVAYGGLLLGIMNPRVNTNNNIFGMAVGVQAYFATKGKYIAVVISVGRGVFYYLPGDPNRHASEGDKLSDVLNKIDELVGLAVPVFVFGFSKMSRGVSCRSDRRVPTHLVQALGIGYSIDSMIQAMGRATFIGKSRLVENLGAGATVKVLTSADDWEAMRGHQGFVLEMQQRLNKGQSIRAAQQDAAAMLPAHLNYKGFSDRKIGQLKKGVLCKKFSDWFSFATG